jgi:catechol 2,3-dioxygenase-like lactoylglutathione lyase family enzyme
MIEGISHMTFIVQDIEKSSELFKEIFSAVEVYDSSGKNFSYSREKFL